MTSTKLLCKKSGTQCLRNSSTIRPAPAAPHAAPTKMIDTTIFTMGSAPTCSVISASNTTIAIIAPIGSMMIPSHFKMLPTFPSGRTCRSSGPITVGPVTNKIDPNNTDNRQFNPNNAKAASAATAKVIAAPHVTKAQITPRDALCSRRFSVSPPSNRISATASETAGSNNSPNNLSGSSKAPCNTPYRASKRRSRAQQ